MLWKRIADESAIRCCTSATLDFKTVQERSKHEGLSFLTITLPAFGKDLERGLELGQVDRRLFAGFRRKAELPRFLGGFLDLVFDRGTGSLLDEPSLEAILALRQLTLMFGKILVPCSDARVAEAFDSFVECESEVRSCDDKRLYSEILEFRRVATVLFGKSLAKLERKLAGSVDEAPYRSLIPKHGPGSTADQLLGNEKYGQRTWPLRLDQVFPAVEYLVPNEGYTAHLRGVDFCEPGQERPVKVTAVPKTLKTPRIIGMEPTAMQYAQQAILPAILDALSRDDNLRRMIGFDDQTPNQRMAREGSLTGKLATLDLSEASDRVSWQLVRAMFLDYPFLFRAISATRSLKADVPGYGTMPLSKYACMGSALCFPLEAMVFLTLIFLGMEELNEPVSKSVVVRRSREVRVYGDDLLVPVDKVHAVIASLTSFGLVVNARKSFWNGKFRESCGREYYAGENVSIVRVRRVFPTSRRDAQEVISVVSLRNQLYFAGYWATVKWLDDWIVGVIKHFPSVLESSPVLGRHSVLGYYSQMQDAELHKPLVRGFVVTARIPENSLDGPGALLKFLIKQGGLPSVDEEHLKRSGRPKAVDIKLGWNSAI